MQFFQAVEKGGKFSDPDILDPSSIASSSFSSVSLPNLEHDLFTDKGTVFQEKFTGIITN